MSRVVVFGNPGSGKSRFARRIAAEFQLPYVSLDALFWKPGWVESDHAEFRARVAQRLDQQSYVVDGNYFTPLGEGRMALADRIFWFDLPRLLCVAGVLQRIVTGYGRVRPEMAEGCPERLDLGFLRFVWNYPARNQAKFVEIIERAGPQARSTRFMRRRDVDAMLAKITREGLA